MENCDLPEEILIEIFSRLPAKSVGRCRCLSKSWRRNLSTSQFISSHLTHATNQQEVILLSLRGSLHTIRIPFVENDTVVPRKLDFTDANVVDYCNGLVLLWGKEDELFVVNPLTLQQVTIQSTTLSVSVDDDYDLIEKYGFGYHSCCDDYKIVRISQVYTNELAESFIDVYSMKKGLWKRLTNLPYDGDFSSYGVFVNGAIHWLVETRDGGYVMAAFDVATDSFHGIPVPNGDFEDYKLLRIRGCLLMLHEALFTEKDKWIMEEYGQVNSWTKCSTISASNNQYCGESWCAIGDDEIVLSPSGDSDTHLIVWKLTDGTTKDVIVNGGLNYLWSCCTFTESLVSPIQYKVAS